MMTIQGPVPTHGAVVYKNVANVVLRNDLNVAPSLRAVKGCTAVGVPSKTFVAAGTTSLVEGLARAGRRGMTPPPDIMYSRRNVRTS